MSRLDVQSGGLIDLDSKGLQGGYNGSVFGGVGETYNELDEIVSGAATDSGAMPDLLSSMASAEMGIANSKPSSNWYSARRSRS